MSKEINFLKEINETLASTFTDILYGKPGSFQFFKKAQKVIAEQPASNATDFYVWVYSMNSSDDRITTFNDQNPDGDYTVYRNPVMTTFEVCLSCPKIDLNEKLMFLEKVNAYFFDNKLMKPIVPKALESVAPVIYQRLVNSDAQLSMTQEPVDHLDNGVTIKFQYKALYHSGSPIRVEKKVQTRKVDISQQRS